LRPLGLCSPLPVSHGPAGLIPVGTKFPFDLRVFRSQAWSFADGTTEKSWLVFRLDATRLDMFSLVTWLPINGHSGIDSC
jgi:hypothetical protein